MGCFREVTPHTLAVFYESQWLFRVYSKVSNRLLVAVCPRDKIGIRGWFRAYYWKYQPINSHFSLAPNWR